MPKIAEVKLSSCGLEVADFRKIAIAELWCCGCQATFFLSCGIAIAEVLPSSCRIAIAELRLQNCDYGIAIAD
jgi:hypothetical protein